MLGVVDRRPTMRDVATAAGVSFKTVSRVVNGGEGVRPEMAVRVSEAIVALGYQPDHRAQSAAIGCGDGDDRLRHGSTWPTRSSPAIYRGLEDVAWQAGHVVLAGSSDGDGTRTTDPAHAHRGGVSTGSWSSRQGTTTP